MRRIIEIIFILMILLNMTGCFLDKEKETIYIYVYDESAYYPSTSRFNYYNVKILDDKYEDNAVDGINGRMWKAEKGKEIEIEWQFQVEDYLGNRSEWKIRRGKIRPLFNGQIFVIDVASILDVSDPKQDKKCYSVGFKGDKDRVKNLEVDIRNYSDGTRTVAAYYRNMVSDMWDILEGGDWFTVIQWDYLEDSGEWVRREEVIKVFMDGQIYILGDEAIYDYLGKK